MKKFFVPGMSEKGEILWNEDPPYQKHLIFIKQKNNFLQ